MLINNKTLHPYHPSSYINFHFGNHFFTWVITITWADTWDLIPHDELTHNFLQDACMSVFMCTHEWCYTEAYTHFTTIYKCILMMILKPTELIIKMFFCSEHAQIGNIKIIKLLFSKKNDNNRFQMNWFDFLPRRVKQACKNVCACGAYKIQNRLDQLIVWEIHHHHAFTRNNNFTIKQAFQVKSGIFWIRKGKSFNFMNHQMDFTWHLYEGWWQYRAYQFQFKK